MTQLVHRIDGIEFQGKELVQNPDGAHRLNNQQDYDEMLVLALSSLGTKITDLTEAIETLEGVLTELKLIRRGHEENDWGKEVSEEDLDINEPEE
uniref:Uncharacterized protein n=1 Tax=viral metagenome TaxID=1070528 RepID=A0A6M3XVF9_9ZZZZ